MAEVMRIFGGGARTGDRFGCFALCRVVVLFCGSAFLFATFRAIRGFRRTLGFPERNGMARFRVAWRVRAFPFRTLRFTEFRTLRGVFLSRVPRRFARSTLRTLRPFAFT